MVTTSIEEVEGPSVKFDRGGFAGWRRGVLVQRQAHSAGSKVDLFPLHTGKREPSLPPLYSGVYPSVVRAVRVPTATNPGPPGGSQLGSAIRMPACAVCSAGLPHATWLGRPGCPSGSTSERANRRRAQRLDFGFRRNRPIGPSNFIASAVSRKPARSWSHDPGEARPRRHSAPPRGQAQ